MWGLLRRFLGFHPNKFDLVKRFFGFHPNKFDSGDFAMTVIPLVALGVWLKKRWQMPSQGKIMPAASASETPASKIEKEYADHFEQAKIDKAYDDEVEANYKKAPGPADENSYQPVLSSKVDESFEFEEGSSSLPLKINS